MPELPEVEVTRRSFAQRISGAQVRSVRMGKPLRWPLGADPAVLCGQTVHGVDRRGKYLLVRLDAAVLLLHLGMSGSLQFAGDLPPAGPHDHFELHTDRGLLRLTDPRRFGAVVWAPALDAEPVATLLGGLGLEPFDERFDGLHLHAALSGRRVAIKQALLPGHCRAACQALLDLALERGGRDNITVVVACAEDLDSPDRTMIQPVP